MAVNQAIPTEDPDPDAKSEDENDQKEILESGLVGRRRARLSVRAKVRIGMVAGVAGAVTALYLARVASGSPSYFAICQSEGGAGLAQSILYDIGRVYEAVIEYSAYGMFAVVPMSIFIQYQNSKISKIDKETQTDV